VAHFDRAILPGREGNITLTLNLGNLQGPVWKSATIVSNDPQKPLTTLNFHGMVRPFIEIRPAFLVQFKGTNEKQQEQEKEVDLITSSQPFKILRIENTLGDKIAYQLETIVKERHYRLKIINRQKMEKYFGKIKCFTTHPKKPEIQILIRSTLDE
jgi:hypothetical protein